GAYGLEPGQEAELRPRLAEFLAGAVSRSGSGYILAIEYGDRAADLYRRPRGTAMAYYRHRANEDLLARAGHQDITAHVDFTALSAAAADVGFREAGMTSQMKFLLAMGLAERIEALESEDLAEKERVIRRLGMTALIKPGGMGEMFKVWIGARGAPVQLRGLRDPFAAC
ncbi:MAG: SAM-dependent methyltransferase, partial [Acidobacteria bacterium]|nr:SAM-dependent methyltransferase [Acidobacteriota bacterium]